MKPYGLYFIHFYFMFGLSIVDYNTANLTLKLLDQFQKNAAIRMAVTINGDDFTINDKDVIVLRSNNIGYACGHNQNIAALKNLGIHRVLILNTDLRLSPNEVIGLFSSLDKRTAIVAPRVILSDRNIVQGPYLRPSFFTEVTEEILILPYLWRKYRESRQNYDNVFRVIGAVFVVDTAKIYPVFDEFTFLGSEEDILGERLLELGFKTKVDENTVVFHDHGVARRKFGLIRSELKFLNSRKYYFHRYRNIPKPITNLLYIKFICRIPILLLRG